MKLSLKYFMESTVLKLFGTGQVTLPKKWRTRFKTKYYTAVMEGDRLILAPLEEEKVFFDANEFNQGQGVDIGVFYKALKKSLK
jgi:bifunctional DNA-binding transcriptional regulator/antitoxin component of YhaV-PrlF toxin-antitoxin module